MLFRSPRQDKEVAEWVVEVSSSSLSAQVVSEKINELPSSSSLPAIPGNPLEMKWSAALCVGVDMHVLVSWQVWI